MVAQVCTQTTTYSPNPATNQAIHDLLALGLNPIPVAPAFPVEQYPSQKNPKEPRFNGKNPSYLDRQGKPIEVKHSHYRGKLPTEAELREWFQDERTGLGTNGGGWLDIDLKRFPSPAAMESAVAPIIDAAQWVERTQRGGYRVALAPEQKPDFQNFGIGDVDHAGEFLNGGGFVVLAPTVGEHGEYTRLKFGEPLKVGSLSELGIRPTKKTTAPAEPTPPPAPTVAPTAPGGDVVALPKLLSKKASDIVSGRFGDDRSDDLVKVAREAFGWENIARAEGIAVSSADSIVATVAEAAGLVDRLDRILSGVNRESCEPALAYVPGKGRADCVKKLERASGKLRPGRSGDILLSDEDTPGLIAFRELYDGQNYVNIGGEFYLYTGNETDGYYYQKREERAERNRISGVLKRCIKVSETEKNGVIVTRPYATAAKRNDALQWCLDEIRIISADEVNPPGLNLKNGILQFHFGPNGVEPKLIHHSPELVYTYPPQVAYKPQCDDTAAQKLLEAIDSRYRHAVLRVIASALDLELVRKHKGRAVRSLIFSGSGSNGKDAIREAIAYIFGRSGITSCTIEDFHAYDQGRRFNLASLAGSRINWASENKMGVNIDDIQSLKQLITGDPLISEEKFSQGQEFTPRCIGIFSTNDRSINLTAALEAIATRYAIVPFTKTFKTNPKGPHELKADSRFKYDFEWVKSEVCPALLNILISQFQAIFTDGIDYSVFDEQMEENRIEANHLYRFSLDTGLIEDPDGMVPIAELEAKLRTWYLEEGILTRNEDGREFWDEAVRPGDPWVKGTPHYKKRFSKIFPNIASYRTKEFRAIRGIRFTSPAIEPLKKVESYNDYCKVVELFGIEETLRAFNVFLSPEDRARISALTPDTAPAPAPAPEPATAEISDEDAQLQAAILAEAVETEEVEALAHFEKFSQESKTKIWAAIPPDQRPGVAALAERYKNRPATVQEWAESHGGIDAAMATTTEF